MFELYGNRPGFGKGAGGISASIAISSNTIDEDAATSSVVGALSVSNGSGSYTFSITADPDAKFDISGSNLIIDATLDYGTATSHSVTVQADNGVDDPISRQFTITVNNTVAPNLSSPADAVSGSTGANWSVETDEGNGTLYWYVSESATPPGAADLKAGTGAAAFGLQAVSATGEQSGSASGLSTDTTYYTHFLHSDNADNDSTIVSADGFATPDVTAPTLSSPSGTQTGSTTADLSVSTNEGNGTLYWYVSESATPPNAADLEAGTGAAASGSQAVSGTGTQPAEATGLSAETTYYAHFLHTDAAANDSAIATSAGFTTEVASAAVTRIVAAGTKFPQDQRTPRDSGEISLQFRLPIWIGKDCDNLKAHFDYMRMSTNEIAMTGTGCTIEKLALEKDGGSYVAWTFDSGTRTRDFTDKDSHVTDTIAASAFGLSKFTRGDLYWVRGYVTLDATSRFPIGCHYNYPNSICRQFDVSDGTPTVDGTGTMSAITGGLSVTSGWGPTAITGETTDTSVPSVVVYGDSIAYSQGDTSNSTSNYQIGYPLRAAFDASNANPIPVAIFARPGDRGRDFGLDAGGGVLYSDVRRSYAQYADIVHWALGTNDCDPPGFTTPDQPQYRGIEENHDSMIALRDEFLLSNPSGKFTVSKVFTRTSGDERTLAGQTTQFPDNPEWWTTADTCNADVFNATLDTDLGNGDIDGIMEGASILTADRRHWITDEAGSSPQLPEAASNFDGTHIPRSHSKLAGQECRTLWLGV